MPTERFEMKIDSVLLARLDHWRATQDEYPSRAEAVRMMIEAGLAHDNQGKPIHFSDGEKLLSVMLGDLIKGLKVKTDTNVDLVQNVIYGGHYWALGWEMPGVFHDHIDKRSQLTFVVNVLDMWNFIEEAFEKLDDDGKAALAAAADPFGKHVSFPGFDGNNEAEYVNIARFLIDDLNRFRRFKDHKRDLNSHMPTLDGYERMLRIFEPIRKTLDFGRSITVEQLAELLNARRYT